MITARSLATHILLHLEKKAAHPDRLIRALLERHGRLDERDRALLTELVYGVLRWQGRLDWHIDALSRVSPRKIDPGVRIILRMALYQIFFLDRIPPHAAVNEAVKMARSGHPAHVAGFVNGLLREALRRQEAESWEFPPVAEQPAARLAVVLSHPRWLVERLLKNLGFEETQALLEANNTVAPLVLRVNSLKATADAVMSELQGLGVKAGPSPYLSSAVRISGLRQDVSRLLLFEEGRVQVQDEASQIISLLLAPESGERVLDLCAGFGGKSSHLGILMGNRGTIVSVDQSAWKLEELGQNAERQGVSIIRTVAADALELKPAEWGLFDRVLLDAPCTGFGTLRRNPDIKWRRHLKDPYRFSQLQGALLRHAAEFVRPGGALVYATCTVLPDENEEVIRAFLADHPEWEASPVVDVLPESCRAMVDGAFFRSWPHRHGVDGFFGARLRRSHDGVDMSA